MKTRDRPEKHPRRALVDAILYAARAGRAWWPPAGRLPAPTDRVPVRHRWEQDEVTGQILPVVREQSHVQESRDRQPSAGLTDSWTVNGAGTPSARVLRLLDWVRTDPVATLHIVRKHPTSRDPA